MIDFNLDVSFPPLFDSNYFLFCLSLALLLLLTLSLTDLFPFYSDLVLYFSETDTMHTQTSFTRNTIYRLLRTSVPGCYDTSHSL